VRVGERWETKVLEAKIGVVILKIVSNGGVTASYQSCTDHAREQLGVGDQLEGPQQMQ
jgi:hypothetical protein